MNININIEVTKVFEQNEDALNDPSVALIVNRGGLRSSKTISVLQVLTLKALQTPNTEIVMVASSIPKIKKSLLKDWKKIVMAGIFTKVGRFNQTDMLYKFSNGSQIQFMSGDLAQEEYRGITSDYLFIDEINTIKQGVYQELHDRCKNTTIVAFNPSAEFYITDEVNNRKDVTEIISTFRDNPFISKEQKQRWIAKGKLDPNYARVMINGLYGNLNGLIFIEGINWGIIKELPEEFDDELWGIDFGYSPDPLSVNQIRIVGNDIYIREWIYETETLLPRMAKLIKEANPHNKKMIADSAGKDIIANLKRTYGINVIKVDKPQILPSISLLKERHVWVTEDSLNVIQEFRYYQWSEKKKDKNGHTIPNDNFNHAIDNIRYVTQTKFGKPKRKKARFR